MKKGFLRSLIASTGVTLTSLFAGCGESSPPQQPVAPASPTTPTAAKAITSIGELDTSALQLEGTLTLYTGKEGRNFLLEQTQSGVTGYFFQNGKLQELYVRGKVVQGITPEIKEETPEAILNSQRWLEDFLARQGKTKASSSLSDAQKLITIGELYCELGTLPARLAVPAPWHIGGGVVEAQFGDGRIKRISPDQPAPTPDP